MLQAAQQAEDDLHAVQRVAREAVGMSQAFHASATGGVPIAAGAFPSQAEKTLTCYSGDSWSPAAGNAQRSMGIQRPWSCFGCGGPHPYSEFRGTEGHVIVCPNKDNPGVRENAARIIERMRKNRKKRHAQNLKRKNLGTANLSNFDEQDKKRITKQVLASMTSSRTVGKNSSVASSVSTLCSPSNHDRSYGRNGGGGVVLVADVVPSLQVHHSSALCTSPFKAIFHTLVSSLAPIWIAQTALRFAVLSIRAPHLLRESSISLRQWQSAFRTASRRCTPRTIMCQSYFQESSNRIRNR